MTSAPVLTVRRVVTTRAGGCSAPPYDSFNLGDHVGDDPVAVRRNRLRLAETMGLSPERLIWMEQIHSRTVAVVDGPRREPVAATDGVVTTTPELALVVVTADCVPVLLSDVAAGVIGAAHAGRIGAREGIVPRLLDEMVELGARPERVEALLGPAASGRQYEVPIDMRADVERHLPGSATTTERGTPGLDLRAGIRQQLRAAGVGTIAQDARCTIEDATLFSHRRSTRRTGAPTGRLASAIWLETSMGWEDRRPGAVVGEESSAR